MKAIKKVLATLLCLCLLCGMAVTAFAENEPTGSITIQNPSHSEATVGGKTFNVYKVFNATTSGTSTSYSWYVDDNGKIPFYDYFYGPNGVVEQNKADGNVQGAVKYVTDIQKNNGNLALSQLAEALHTYITEANKTVETTISTVIPPVEVNGGETSVKIADLTYGYYLVYDNTDLSGNSSAVRSAVMLTTVNKDAVVTLKANRPEIDKMVLENDGSTYGKGTSAMIGEDVTFKVETLVPSHTLYTTYKYFINDTLPTGLTLHADTIKVYLGDTNTTPLVDGTDYVLSVPGDNGASFKVDFTAKMTGADQYAIGEKLIVVYDAHVTNGIAAQAANTNTATLTYSNDPTNEDSVGTTSSVANVYSYQFVFTKFAEDTSGVFKNVRLIGAEFKLYKVEGGTRTPVYFTTEPAQNAAGVSFTKYIVAEAEQAGVTTDTLKVHETGDETLTLDHLNYGGHRGDVFIFGLSEGKYELEETKAPDGYVLADKPFAIEIVDAIGELGSVGTLSVTSSYAGEHGSIVNTNGMGEQILTVWADITNEPGAALPETGGMGTTLFTVLGVILMAGAIAFFTSRKRSSLA